ncbi:hypothetical protein ACHAQH_004160 [Verticillium albo-atrum]
MNLVEDGIPGYEMMIPTWEVEISPGGPIIEVTGTIEEVTEQLHKANPNFEEDWGILPRSAYNDDEEPEAPGVSPRRLSSLERRTDFSGAKTLCNIWGWNDNCTVTVIRNDIKYLRGVKGRPTAGPGPGQCARVGCQNGCGTFWCNDARSTKSLASFGSIADGAQRIIDICYKDIKRWAFNGQAFHKTDWNVIVRGQKC